MVDGGGTRGIGRTFPAKAKGAGAIGLVVREAGALLGGTGGGCVVSEETLLVLAAERDWVDWAVRIGVEAGTAAGEDADCLCREVKIENGDFLVVVALGAAVFVGDERLMKASLREL